MERFVINMLKEEVRGTKRGKGSGDVCYDYVKGGSEDLEREREWRGML